MEKNPNKTGSDINIPLLETAKLFCLFRVIFRNCE